MTDDRAHPLRCRCGQLQGRVHRPDAARRAVCYCRDCQAFAHHLGHPERTLDALGGTDITATLPRHIEFSAGVERIACMSLSPKGLYRWYADCCRTPIGNTPRNPKVAYIGLVHDVLDTPPARLDASFGPPRMHVNRDGARGPVPADGWATSAVTLLHLMRSMLGARLGGRWRDSPLFRAGTDEPLRTPQVLSREQRAALMEKVA